MNLKRIILSTVAVAAIAGIAGTASASGRDDHRHGPTHGSSHGSSYGSSSQDLFLRQEAARREVQDQERELRSQRRFDKYELERKQYIRDYGVNSPEYRWFRVRWEKQWNNAVERERNLMVEQRMAARRRFEQQRMDINRYDFLGVTSSCIDRDLQRYGVMLYPTDRNDRPVYGSNDRDYRDSNGRDRDYRDVRDSNRRDRDFRDADRRERDVNVDWKFGVGVRVHN